MPGAPKATTSDTLYGGAVHLRQPAGGYRVNVDAPILADFAAQGPRARVAIDLGAGVGSIALGLQHVDAAAHFELVEREATLLELAAENARGANMSHRTWCCELATGLPDELRQAADLVVSNPPYFELANTRQGPDAAKTRARFGELAPFLSAAADAVRGARTRVAFVYPARELSRFLAMATRLQLVPKRLRLVHADARSPARVALIELRRAKPGGLVILPPLLEWASKGVRSPELAEILAGKRVSAEAKASDRK
ncbi:MAG: methyltransferase [Polyangiaceae bacterium]